MDKPFNGVINTDIRDSTPATFRGGTILQVEVSTGDDQYLDLEKEAHALLARE